LGNAGADLTTAWCCSTPFGLTLRDEAVQDGGSAARCSCNGGVDLLVSRGDAGGGASTTFKVRGTMRCVRGICGRVVGRPSLGSSLGGDSLGGYGHASMRVAGALVFEVQWRSLAGGWQEGLVDGKSPTEGFAWLVGRGGARAEGDGGGRGCGEAL
jgi:hypothetical protein